MGNYFSVEVCAFPVQTYGIPRLRPLNNNIHHYMKNPKYYHNLHDTFFCFQRHLRFIKFIFQPQAKPSNCKFISNHICIRLSNLLSLP